MRALISVLALSVVACGGSVQNSEPVASRPPAPKPLASAAPPAQKPPAGALFRDDVDGLVDQGLGRFLQEHLDVKERVVGGQFLGWSIVTLKPAEFWSGVDLKPGDVVTRINDLPIQRDTEAYDAFQSLKIAQKLIVSYERDGKAQKLEYKIIPR